MPVFSSHGFQRGNSRPTARVWTAKSYARLTALPTQSTVDKGVISVDLQANVPSSQAGQSLTAPLVQYGQLFTGSPTMAFNYPNEMFTRAYADYTHAVCLQTKIKVYAIPFGGPSSDPDQGLDPTSVYTPEAQVSLSITKTRQQFGASTDLVSAACVNGSVSRAYNTGVGFTRQNVGARAVGCTLEATYTPSELFQFDDIMDNLFEHSFPTLGDVTMAQENPFEDAFFSIVIGPPRSGCPNAAGTAIVHGRVLPHRVSIEFEHKVLFYNDAPGLTDNIPLSAPSAESSFATRVADAGAAAAEMFDGADDPASLPGMSRTLAKRLRRGRDGSDM